MQRIFAEKGAREEHDEQNSDVDSSSDQQAQNHRTSLPARATIADRQCEGDDPIRQTSARPHGPKQKKRAAGWISRRTHAPFRRLSFPESSYHASLPPASKPPLRLRIADVLPALRAVASSHAA